MFGFRYCESYYSKARTTLRINIDPAMTQLQNGAEAAIVSFHTGYKYSVSIIVSTCHCITLV